MKNVFLPLAIALLVGIQGCAPLPSYQRSFQSAFTQTNHDAIDRIVAALPPVERGQTTVLVATLVDIDAMNVSSRFGRLVAEQFSARLTQHGFDVKEVRLRGSLKIREGTGELMLSRNLQDLAREYQVSLVLAGTYAVAAEHVYVTAKVIGPSDNRTYAAVNYAVPLTDNNRALLAAAKENGPAGNAD